MEALRKTSPHHRSEMRDNKVEACIERISNGNGSRLSAPVAVYPFPRYRNHSLIEDDERRLALIHRPSVSRTGTSSRKAYKTYTISEILKKNDNSEHGEDYDDSTNQLAVERHCYTANREPLVRETYWSYEDGSSSQQCNTCCQCYPSIRYPCTLPYRTWQIAGDREAFQCGYASTGMSIVYFGICIFSV